MILTKILRLLRHRWWVVAAIAVTLGALGVVTTQSRNSQIQPTFQAGNRVNLDAGGAATAPRPGQALNVAEVDLEEALALATQVNMAIIDDGRGQVTIAERTTVLVFQAMDRTEEGALRTAEAMGQAWADATRTSTVEARAERLREIVDEASLILSQIEVLQPPADPEATIEVPSTVLARFELLEAIAGGLQPQLTNLEIDKVLAELGNDRAGTVEEIDAQIVLIGERLEEVYAELADIGSQYGLESTVRGTPDPVVTPDPGEAPSPGDLETVWQLEALQSQYTELGDEFEALFALGSDVSLPPFEDPEVVDLTPARGSAMLFGLVGALLGSLLAFGALFAFATLRRRTYISSDLAPVPVFSELPAVSHGRNGRHLESAERLEGIKQLRNSLTAYIKDTDVTPAIGLTRVSIDPQHARQLAVDLGRRMAASDLRVLLIDLDLDAAKHQADPSEYHSLAEFWSDIRSDPQTGAEVLHRILSTRFESAPGTMCVIVSGAVEEESDDLILTRSFGIFLDVCRQEADIILAVAPDASTSATQSLLQRLDGVVAVCGVGVSTRDDVLALAAGGHLLGASLLTGSVGRSRGSRDSTPSPNGRSGQATTGLPGNSDTSAETIGNAAQNGASSPALELVEPIPAADPPN